MDRKKETIREMEYIHVPHKKLCAPRKMGKKDHLKNM